MKFGDGGNVITENLFNFTEAFVCLKRLDPEQLSEVQEAKTMQRRSTPRKVVQISDTARRASPRTTARSKPTTAVSQRSKGSIRSPIKIEAEDVVKIPAKRNKLNGSLKMPASRLEGPSHQARKSFKQTNESKDGVTGGKVTADLKKDSAALVTLRGIRPEHLRECSIVLKSVEIPDTVHLDAKSKRRWSSLFRACRKSGTDRTTISRDDPAPDADVSKTGPSSGQPRVEEEPKEKVPVNSKIRGRAAIGKRRRDSGIDAMASSGDEAHQSPESKETTAADTSNLVRQKRGTSGKTPSTGPSENPAKRRKVTARKNGRVSPGEHGHKATNLKRKERSSEIVEDEDGNSMCWDESPDKSPEKLGEDAADSSGNQIPHDYSNLALALRNLRVPMLGHPGYLTLQPAGRCAHCSCTCKVEDEKVDKNQPLITSFLRRTSKEPRVDTHTILNSATTESQRTTSPTEEPRDSAAIQNLSESVEDRPGDIESIFADSPPDSERVVSVENLPTEITSPNDPEHLRDTGSDVDADACIVVGTERESTVEDFPESEGDHSVSPRRLSDSESVPDRVQGESVVSKENPIINEETCNESDKDRCSVSEVKLVLEESSDGSRDENEIIDNGADATSKASPSFGSIASKSASKPGDLNDKSEPNPGSSVSPEAVVDVVDVGGNPQPENQEIGGKLVHGDSAQKNVCGSDEGTDFETTTCADSLLSQKSVLVNDVEEAGDTAPVTGDVDENNSSKQDENCKDSHDEERKSSKEPIANGKISEGGLDDNNDAITETEQTSESLLAGKLPEPDLEKCDEACEEPIPVVEVSDRTKNDHRDDEDEICDTANVPISGSEVLCFVATDTKENQLSGVDLGLASPIALETSPDADGDSKMDQDDCLNDGIDKGKTVVQVASKV